MGIFNAIRKVIAVASHKEDKHPLNGYSETSKDIVREMVTDITTRFCQEKNYDAEDCLVKAIFAIVAVARIHGLNDKGFRLLLFEDINMLDGMADAAAQNEQFGLAFFSITEDILGKDFMVSLMSRFK